MSLVKAETVKRHLRNEFSLRDRCAAAALAVSRSSPVTRCLFSCPPLALRCGTAQRKECSRAKKIALLAWSRIKCREFFTVLFLETELWVREGKSSRFFSSPGIEVHVILAVERTSFEGSQAGTGLQAQNWQRKHLAPTPGGIGGWDPWALGCCFQWWRDPKMAFAVLDDVGFMWFFWFVQIAFGPKCV